MAKILIIEDDAELRLLLERELAAAGFDCVLAADGEQGLAAHASDPPDLVVLDWMLPGIDGLEVLRRLRTEATTPVLMLTARGEEIDRVIGLELGADDYLPKPFGIRELLARIRALLRRAELVRETLTSDRAGQSERLTYDAIVLDPVAHAVTSAGEDVDLSQTEFELLHLFLRNRGRAFSRAYLLETVWGVREVPGDRSVDNAILRLRRKLGDAGSAIETVWGVGYRLRKA
jgi:DNA-binding response OmpR family regulator